MNKDPIVARTMFVDEVDIAVTSGDGGHGCMSFRREKYIPKGGPDGGDGGSGGSVYLEADDTINTLHHLAGKHHWKAQTGGHGWGKNRHGKNADDLIIPVPAGTLIYDTEKDVMLKDLATPGQRICVAKGGKGGKGNARFKTATNQAPREFETGEPGEQRKLHLELKLIADVALVGKPNAGKSTLISRLSAAKPKIAAYPFTTLTPSLGIVELSGFRRFVIADIPGLIEGAHAGQGLGHEFLRHIERTKIILHMVDICPLTGEPLDDYHAIKAELEKYSQKLANTPEIVVANKIDITQDNEKLNEFASELGVEVFPISAVTGKGLEPLKEKIWQLLHPENQ